MLIAFHLIVYIEGHNATFIGPLNVTFVRQIYMSIEQSWSHTYKRLLTVAETINDCLCIVNYVVISKGNRQVNGFLTMHIWILFEYMFGDFKTIYFLRDHSKTYKVLH